MTLSVPDHKLPFVLCGLAGLHRLTFSFLKLLLLLKSLQVLVGPKVPVSFSLHLYLLGPFNHMGFKQQVLH